MRTFAKRFLSLLTIAALAATSALTLAATEAKPILVSANNLKTRSSADKLCWNMTAATFVKSYNSFAVEGETIKTYQPKANANTKHLTRFDGYQVAISATVDGYVYLVSVAAADYATASEQGLNGALDCVVKTLLRNDANCATIVERLATKTTSSQAKFTGGSVRFLSTWTSGKGGKESFLMQATPVRPTAKASVAPQATATVAPSTPRPTEAPSGFSVAGDGVIQQSFPMATSVPQTSAEPTQKPIVATDDHTGTVYILQAGSDRTYHRSTCIVISDSDVEELPRASAKARGYTACKVCNP